MIKQLLSIFLLSIIAFSTTSQAQTSQTCEAIKTVTTTGMDSFRIILAKAPTGIITGIAETRMKFPEATKSYIDFDYESNGAYIAEFGNATAQKMQTFINGLNVCGKVYSDKVAGKDEYHMGFYASDYYDRPFGKVFVDGGKMKLAIYMGRNVRYHLIQKQTYKPNEKIQAALLNIMNCKGDLGKLKKGDFKEDASALGKKMQAGYWESSVPIPGTMLSRVETSTDEKTKIKEEKYWSVVGTQLPYEKADSLFQKWDEVV
ncbi:MAG: hypothetical protein NTX03_09395, partial [Bacteroidetes bacterium]|nr:hypothetical protein [Bacteroidota bacterium]